MRTEAEITADAADSTPFSNMTAFEVWTAGNCARSSGCVRDDTWGSGTEGASCPLLTVAVLGKWPVEWPNSDGEPGECTEFEEVVARATDDEPDEEPRWRPVETIKGQEGLF